MARVAALAWQVASAEARLATRAARQPVVYASYRQAADRLQAACDEQVRESQAVQAELARLERRYETACAAQLAALRVASSRGAGASAAGGTGGGAVNPATGLSWPLASYVVTRPFGENYDPILKQVRMHTGMDLAAPEGTPVPAAGAGVVFFTGWMNG